MTGLLIFKSTTLLPITKIAAAFGRRCVGAMTRQCPFLARNTLKRALSHELLILKSTHAPVVESLPLSSIISCRNNAMR
jgi:hypothetical protein